MKKVSIIIPVYKVEKYIDQCLESVTSQTYSNLEIILVDDGSPDNCPEICEQWKRRDDRIRVIHQENQGVSCARNAALKAMTGDYILFIDSDDWIAHTMVEKLVGGMESAENVDAVFCGLFEADELGQIRTDVAYFPGGVVDRNEGAAQIFGEYRTAPWNKMFKVELFLHEIWFDPKLKIGEDELWVVEALKNANRIALLPEPLYYYRVRKDSASMDYSLSEARLSEVASQRRVLEEIMDYGSDELTLLAQERLYYRGQIVMKCAFYHGNYEQFFRIDKEIDPERKIWFANHGNFLGSCRRKLVEAMMRMRFPRPLVSIFDKRE